MFSKLLDCFILFESRYLFIAVKFAKGEEKNALNKVKSGSVFQSSRKAKSGLVCMS